MRILSSVHIRALALGVVAVAAFAVVESCTIVPNLPSAVFQLVVTGTGNVGGTYTWSPTSVSGGAFTGSYDYFYNSCNDPIPMDTKSYGLIYEWFLSSSTNHSTPAADADVIQYGALPGASGVDDWDTHVVTTVDRSQGGILPTTSPEAGVTAGEVLTVGYLYSDVSGSAENTSATTFQWQSSTSQPPTDASFTDVVAETQKTYQTSGGDSGHYLRVKVTVAAMDGTKASTAAASPPVYIP